MVVDSVESTLTRMSRGHSPPQYRYDLTRGARQLSPRRHTLHVSGAQTRLGRAVRTAYRGTTVRTSPCTVAPQVESTPNPSSFLLRLDAAPEGLAATGLRGQTFYGGDLLCPPAMAAALATEGVESIFACGDMLTVSKLKAAQWDAVLPTVIEALGGASEALVASGLQPAAGGGAAGGGVAIRLQVSQIS